MSGIILGEKSEQTQMFDDKGDRIPVTFILTAPCYCIDIKTPKHNTYFSIQVGYGNTKTIAKSKQGHVIKAGIKTPLRFFKEFRMEPYGDTVKLIEEDKKKGISFGEVKIFVGDELKPNALFKKGDIVKVSGTSKGKGFQGVVARHHFKGGPRTHGQSDRERGPGSIGQTTTPGRVYKGKRMAGRKGGQRVTVRNLKIVEAKENGLLIKGLTPGFKGGLIEIRSI